MQYFYSTELVRTSLMCVNIFVHACVGVCGGGGHVGSNYKVLLLTNER